MLSRHPHPSSPAIRHALVASIALAAPLALAQTTPQQVVRGPVATYWLTADTTSGIGALASGGMGIGSMLGMLAGRAPGPVRTLDLRLGSSQGPSGAPQAMHLIPPSMSMGPSLPLVTPEPVARETSRDTGERALPQGMEQPKGRMLIFWGCGEKVGPGQPIVIDFSKIGPGQAPLPNLVSRNLRIPRGPAFGVNRTFGGWPNEKDRQSVPGNASLRGEHEVKGNYSPEIRFTVDQHDFMPPVELNSARTAAGTQQLTWRPVGGATGYFMTAFGANGEGGGQGGGTDMVMWTSSTVQEMGGALTDHVPPGEVARMIRERVVLPPDRTECTMPAEVLKAMPMGILNFVAYGDELNVSHPPRPADPKVPWDIQWTVKLRLRSTTMTPLGEGMAGMMGGGGGRSGSSAGAPPSQPSSQPSGGDSAGGALGGLPGAATEAVEQGVQMLKGLFGR